MMSEKEYFKGELSLSYAPRKLEDNYVSMYDESLFFKVPKHILSFIDGCPSRVTTVEISYDEDNERVLFCTTEKESERPRFTVPVSVDKILKLVEIEGIRRNEDAIFAISGR